MKSERRHELQQNSLARSLEGLPKMGRDSGSKLLLGITLVLLVIVLIRFYLNSREQKQEQVAAQLSTARGELNVLRNVGESRQMGEPPTDPDVAAAQRNGAFHTIQETVSGVLASATDGPRVAQAKNIAADACLQMATLGQPPQATTRPDLALPRPGTELLDEAARNYQEVLDIKDGLPPVEAANAHLGLAAVAENRGDWDAARAQYQAVVKDESIPGAFKGYADQRLSLLARISVPISLGQTPTTGPTTGQAGPKPDLRMGPFLPAAPNTGPAAAPATSPAGAPSPTTGPAAPGVPPLGWTTPTTATPTPAAPTTGPAVPAVSVPAATVPTTGPTTRGS